MVERVEITDDDTLAKDAAMALDHLEYETSLVGNGDRDKRRKWYGGRDSIKLKRG